MTDVSAWEQLDFDDPRRLVVFDPEEHHPPLLLDPHVPFEVGESREALYSKYGGRRLG